MSTAPAETRLEHLDLTAVKPHPDNPRVDVGDVTELAESIREVGVLEPIVVAPPHPDMPKSRMGKATYLIVMGHRRHAAARKAKLATVPVIVRDDLTTRAAQVAVMLHENLQRVDLTPVEEADAYQLMMDLDGLTQKDLAARVGQPLSRVRDRLKLAKIGPAGRDALQAHQVTIEQALAIAEFDDDPKTQKDLVKVVGTDNFRFTLNHARHQRERDRELQARLDHLAKNGVTVLDDKPKGARPLEDLLDDFPHRWQATDARVDAAEKRLHKDCPGRVTYWETEYSSKRIVHGCTEPKLHPKTKPAKSPEEIERDARLARLKDEAAAGADAAAAARAEFIRERLAQTADPAKVRDRLQGLVVDALGLDEHWDRDRFGRARLFLLLLDAPLPEEDKGIDDHIRAADHAEAVNEALHSLSVNALVLALDLATHIAGEQCLRKADPEPHDSTYLQARDWIGALTEYGYPWSDWERGRFTGRDYRRGAGLRWTVDGVIADPEPEPDAEPEADEDGAA